MKHLNGRDLKMFLEKYGKGDVYFSHEYVGNGTLEVKFLPSLLNFTEPENIPELIKYLEERPIMAERYLKVIVLTDNFAYIPNDKRSNKHPLVKNYHKFLKELADIEKAKKHSEHQR